MLVLGPHDVSELAGKRVGLGCKNKTTRISFEGSCRFD
jgi:hypothetical protein